MEATTLCITFCICFGCCQAPSEIEEDPALDPGMHGPIEVLPCIFKAWDSPGSGHASYQRNLMIPQDMKILCDMVGHRRRLVYWSNIGVI